MIRRFGFAFLILFFTGCFCSAQDGSEVVQNQFNKFVSPLSPQSADFVRYGNAPISYFTGQADVKIPLYTYKDADFEFPIYAAYNSSGFIPNKRDGIIGLNWFLGVGGVITRTINGVADDRQGYQDGNVPHGLLYGIRNNLGVQSVSRTGVFNDPSLGDVNSGYFWTIGGGCELEPDKFTFSMPGYNGSFFLQNDGTVRVEGNKPLKVDLSGVSDQAFNDYYNINDSEIVITADNGYKYYFGGNVKYLEYSVVLATNSPIRSPEINAWHLTKIEAPNGRIASFQYSDFVQPMGSGSYTKSSTNHFQASVTKFQTGKSSSSIAKEMVLGLPFYHVDVFADNDIYDVIEASKTVYLKSITVDNNLIELAYSAKEKDFYNNYNGLLDADHGLKLDNITVKSGGTVLYTFQFGYNYLKDGQRLFLTSLTESGKNPYLLDYYLPVGDFPSPLITDIDYWGFWVGGYNLAGLLIPKADIMSTGDIVYTSFERWPNPNFSVVGQLKTLTYPTNGYSRYEYEGNSYSKRLERRSSSDFKSEELLRSSRFE